MLDQKFRCSINCSMKDALLPALAVFVWLLIYQDALVSVVRIWYISEIFSHGFFIIPGAIYLIWRERSKLQQLPVKPNYWVLPILVAFLVLGVFGLVGGIQVFYHISAFTVLPLAIWFYVGNPIAKVIWFPLCFMLFSIPIGEQLVPYLQKITADLAIMILNWTSIPSYNTGLYIEIPQGKFVVAEACSGIRFFVGSLVFGAVYSHLSYHSLARKAAFMLLALVVPVLANAVRVFGIVVIGYFSDMEYASGADHIIYGWVFFCIVLFLLVVVGETFREKAVEGTSIESLSGREAEKPVLTIFPRRAGIALLTMLVLVLGWQRGVVPDGEVVESLMSNKALESITYKGYFSRQSNWSPIIEGETDLFRGTLKQDTQSDLADFKHVELVVAWYPENREGSEMVSSSNALYDKEAWSKIGSEAITISVKGIREEANLLNLVSLSGAQRYVLFWYQLPDRVLRSSVKAKLHQSVDVLFGGEGAGALVILSSTYDKDDEEKVRATLLREAGKNSLALSGAIPF